MTDDVPEPPNGSAQSDPGEALAAQPPDDPTPEAELLAKTYTPRPYNPMTIDVQKTQGNRVISTLDLRAKRAATLKGD